MILIYKQITKGEYTQQYLANMITFVKHISKQRSLVKNNTTVKNWADHPCDRKIKCVDLQTL